MTEAHFDEDADNRSHLAALGPAARRTASHPRGSDRTPVLRALTARPASADLATLIAMADTDEVVRLRLLRAIRTSASNNSSNERAKTDRNGPALPGMNTETDQHGCHFRGTGWTDETGLRA
jgi:hypothetical protein